MKYKIVIAEDGWLEAYYRKWFRWQCIGCFETIECTRHECRKHANAKRKQQTYEVFKL